MRAFRPSQEADAWSTSGGRRAKFQSYLEGSTCGAKRGKAGSLTIHSRKKTFFYHPKKKVGKASPRLSVRRGNLQEFDSGRKGGNKLFIKERAMVRIIPMTYWKGGTGGLFNKGDRCNGEKKKRISRPGGTRLFTNLKRRVGENPHQET